MEILDLFFYLQAANTSLAVIFNSFLVYVVTRYTRNNIGIYKWIIVSFAIFEASYAIIVLLGMPVHYVADASWLVFNHGGLIGNTPFAFMGPALYCIFYEIWICFIVFHFIYRYVVVCKNHWKQKVEDHLMWKFVIVIMHLAFLAFTCVCGFFLCTRQMISESPDGIISYFGTITIINHYVLVGSSSIIILFCSVEIWRAIRQMQAMAGPAKEINIQRQMFFSLVIQTAVPVIFCHIPSIIYLSFPFWKRNFSFGLSSLIFTWITTLNKVVDPLIVIGCIKEYRRASISILRGKISQIGISADHDSNNAPVEGSPVALNAAQLVTNES